MSRHRSSEGQDPRARPLPGRGDVPEAPRHRTLASLLPAADESGRVVVPFPRRVPPTDEGTTSPMARPRTREVARPDPAARTDALRRPARPRLTPLRATPPRPGSHRRPAPPRPTPAASGGAARTEATRSVVVPVEPPAATTTAIPAGPAPAPAAPVPGAPVLAPAPESGPEARPVSAAEPGEPGRPGRLLGVDAARGIALLGMIAVHSLADVTEEGAPTWSFSVAAGRAAAIFAVLAGLGIAFLTGRRRVPVREGGGAVAASLGVRALVIGALGLALGYTTTEFAAVILPYYAVLFLLAIPLVLLGTRTLAVLAVAMAIGLPVLSQVLRPRVDVPDIENPWFADVVRDPLGLLLELTLMGDYPAMVWVTYLCVGLVVGRLTLSSARVAGGLLAGGAVLAIGSWVGSSLLLTRAGGLAAIQAGIPASGLSAEDTADILAFGGDGITPTSTWWWLAVVRAHTGTPLDLAHTIGVALAVLGAMLLLTHVGAPGVRQVVAAIQFPLAAVGALTLTLYTAHIVFINSPLDTLSSAGGYALQLVVFALVALAWRATAGRGPLEGVVSSLAGAAARRVGGREGAAGARAPGRSTDQP
jgi:uncharacterized membrane protein